jgi:hypothetical protein
MQLMLSQKYWKNLQNKYHMRPDVLPASSVFIKFCALDDTDTEYQIILQKLCYYLSSYYGYSYPIIPHDLGNRDNYQFKSRRDIPIRTKSGSEFWSIQLNLMHPINYVDFKIYCSEIILKEDEYKLDLEMIDNLLNIGIADIAIGFDNKLDIELTDKKKSILNLFTANIFKLNDDKKNKTICIYGNKKWIYFYLKVFSGAFPLILTSPIKNFSGSFQDYQLLNSLQVWIKTSEAISFLSYLEISEETIKISEEQAEFFLREEDNRIINKFPATTIAKILKDIGSDSCRYFDYSKHDYFVIHKKI